MCSHTLRLDLPSDGAYKAVIVRPASAEADHEPLRPSAPPASLCGGRLPQARPRSWRRGLLGLLIAAGLSVFMVALTPAAALSADPTWLPTGCEVEEFTDSAGTGYAEGRWGSACPSLFTYRVVFPPDLHSLSSALETGYAHFYELEVTAAAEITLRLTEHDTSHIYVLRNAAGAIVAQVMYAYDFSPAQCASIGLVCRSPSRLSATLAAGTYYLELIQYYTHDERQRDFKALFETYSDDDFPAATSTTGEVATDGTAVAGEVRFAGDEDWFAVTLEAGGWYRIDVKGSGSGAGTLRDPYLMGIHTSDGTPITNTSDNNSGATNNSLLFFEGPAAGVHYVAVSGSNNAIGTYTLSVAEEEDEVQVVANPEQLTIDEGAAATYQLQPQGGQWNRMTVEVAVPAGSGLSVQPATVTFTRTDQVRWKTIRVSAARDTNWTDERVTITQSVQGDASITTDDVAVTVRDTGQPRIRISGDPLTLTEGGHDTYQIRLWSAPVGPVTVQINAPAKLSVNPASLGFDASTWSRSRTVTVTALHDDDDIFDEVLFVRHSLTQGSATAPMGQLEVTVVDDDDEEDLVGPRPAGTVWWAALKARRGVQYVGHINYTGPQDTGELSTTTFTYDGVGREINAAFVDDSGHFQIWVDSGNGEALPNSLVLHVGAASMELGSATRQSFRTTYNDGREPTYRDHTYWWAAGAHAVELSDWEVVAVWLEEGEGGRDLPGVPDSVEGQALDGGAELRWEAAAENPAQPVLYYEYTQEGTEGWTRTVGSETTKEVENLTNGESYTFRVRAVNTAGKGAASAPSAPVIPQAASGQDQGGGTLPPAGQSPASEEPDGGGGSSSGGDSSGSSRLLEALTGYLENPGADSFQSGLGVISGWVCAAEAVTLEINGVEYAAAYGTARVDTADVCGDVENGFGLLFNWNLLGDGEHTVVAFVDGEEWSRTTVTVTTLGEEFLRGVTGACQVPAFPLAGETVTLTWQQTSQNFVITAGAAPAGPPNRAGSIDTGYLENPGPNSFQSGIGVLSGWVCEGEVVEIEITPESGEVSRHVAGYGTERLDTQAACGDTNNGFGLLFNWNLLGDGEHAVVAYVDDEELGRATVRVTTLGEEFLRRAVGACVVEDFPTVGEAVTLEWQQNQQNFVVTDIE